MVAERVPRTVDLDALEEPLERIIDRALQDDEPVLLRRGGAAVAWIKPTSAARERQRAILAEASRRFADVPWTDLETEITRAVAEASLEAWRRRHNGE